MRIIVRISDGSFAVEVEAALLQNIVNPVLHLPLLFCKLRVRLIPIVAVKIGARVLYCFLNINRRQLDAIPLHLLAVFHSIPQILITLCTFLLFKNPCAPIGAEIENAFVFKVVSVVLRCFNLIDFLMAFRPDEIREQIPEILLLLLQILPQLLNELVFREGLQLFGFAEQLVQHLKNVDYLLFGVF